MKQSRLAQYKGELVSARNVRDFAERRRKAMARLVELEERRLGIKAWLRLVAIVYIAAFLV